ncbi:MAG: uracil-xanthine permease family protein [Desulfarculus sp.]|nr:uracil-xanthine permease family protein [Pseudomonadota bacterium]MBU4598940.1 uracil-xanthine permease family protein [Pseudomonadota bacterium]MBV1716884.1 uracil-xanthine permease family protein [Desulfarculus sp.]MBV1738387.1 uracil-xanthine permease family protein [Desulfarculus sp.]
MSELSTPEYRFTPKGLLLGAQMLFVAFGALVLVPLLTGLNPNVALFTAGAGTLLFQIITKGKVPVFLASSFAFIAPIIYGTQTWGVPGTLCGLAAAGGMYVIISFVVRIGGPDTLKRILPPVVTGPVIMVIGLILAPVAVNMALGKTGDGSAVLFPQSTALIISLISLAVTITVSLLAKGWLRLVPILVGIGVGYVLSLFFGIVDFTTVAKAPWLAVPAFTFPTWNLEAVLYIVPIAIAPAIEHFGDVLAIGGITGKDYIKDPGIKNTMLGDGLATSLASFLGGPPNTTYSEVTGAVALTRAFNPAIMTWAAIVAVALAFVGKLGAFLLTIPTPVMGGIMVLLFGAIMVVGINTLVRAGHDLMNPRNMTIVALIVIFGTGGMALPIGSFKLAGIGLAGVLGVVLNLVLPGRKAADASLCAPGEDKPDERILVD